MRSKRACFWLAAALVPLVAACVPMSTRRNASVIPWLYPDGKVEPAGGEVHLRLPLRVGVAFVPGSTAVRGAEFAQGPMGPVAYSSIEDTFSEPQQRELLKKVAAAFRGLPDIQLVEILPTHGLAGQRGFEGLKQVTAMYGVNVVALVS
jgi:rhombotail lipoprotein